MKKTLENLKGLMILKERFIKMINETKNEIKINDMLSSVLHSTFSEEVTMDVTIMSRVSTRITDHRMAVLEGELKEVEMQINILEDRLTSGKEAEVGKV